MSHARCPTAQSLPAQGGCPSTATRHGPPLTAGILRAASRCARHRRPGRRPTCARCSSRPACCHASHLTCLDTLLRTTSGCAAAMQQGAGRGRGRGRGYGGSNNNNNGGMGPGFGMRESGQAGAHVHVGGSGGWGHQCSGQPLHRSCTWRQAHNERAAHPHAHARVCTCSQLTWGWMACRALATPWQASRQVGGAGPALRSCERVRVRACVRACALLDVQWRPWESASVLSEGNCTLFNCILTRRW